MKDRKQVIIDTISDLVSHFLNYDRKEDEELSRSDIEEAIRDGEITIGEMIAEFADGLIDGLEET